MTKSLIRVILGAITLGAILLGAPAQEKPAPKKPAPPREDYSEFFKPPETTEDFWHALQYELEIGRHELAAKLLHGLLKRNPSDEELLKIQEKDGMPAILRLRTVPKWSDDPQRHALAVKDADELADRIGKALEKLLGNPKRIGRLIQNLTGDREEQTFAAKELYRSRVLAMPPLIAQLRTAQGDERAAILALLPRLSEETVPLLAAALSIPDDHLRLELIQVIVKRDARETAPALWYLAGSANSTDVVRKQARDALEQLLGSPQSVLPLPYAALTREAERYYRHEVSFPNPDKVLVWRWDDKSQALVSGWPGRPTLSTTQAEEYYGLRYSREALEIEPTYVPAQKIFLSLALDKGMERAGLDQPLRKAAPAVQELLATVNPDLVVQVLNQALIENRLPVILGTVRVLGDLAETRALKPTDPGLPALVQALNYPDRRVQMAAAEALLHIPAVPPPTAAWRVVELLRRAAALKPAAAARPKVLVGFADEGTRETVAKSVQSAGLEPVKASSCREVLQRLSASADIDALLIDTALPNPGLADLLAQLRGDVHSGLLPVWLASHEEEQHLLQDRLVTFRITRQQLREELANKLQEEQKTTASQAQDLRKDIARLQNQLAAYSDEAEFAMLPPRQRIARQREAFRTARQVLREARARKKQDLLQAVGSKEAILAQEIEAIDKQLAKFSDEAENALLREQQRIEREALAAPPRDRTAGLRRLVQRYRNVWLIPQDVVFDPAALKRILEPQLAEVVSRPLTAAERKDYAERSLRWLDRMATGELSGYDIRPAEEVLLGALLTPGLSNEAVIASLDAVSRFPGAKEQTELARVVIDAKRALPVRVAAASGLLRHIQHTRPSLPPVEAGALANLVSARDTDPALKASVALVLGSLRPDPRTTTERLRGYDPLSLPAPVPPPKK
jgi:CheY-like chemotaxis protein